MGLGVVAVGPGVGGVQSLVWHSIAVPDGCSWEGRALVRELIAGFAMYCLPWAEAGLNQALKTRSQCVIMALNLMGFLIGAFGLKHVRLGVDIHCLHDLFLKKISAPCRDARLIWAVKLHS